MERYEDLRIHRPVEVKILKSEDPQLCGSMNAERERKMPQPEDLSWAILLIKMS